jgi:hypothetical protein
MIRLNLEIADTGRHDAVQLRALSAMFLVLADGGKADQVRAALEEKTTAARSERTVGASPALAAPYGAQVVGTGAVLDPADNPATGMPTPAEAFGGHGSPELDADAAKLEALAGAGAAGPTGADLDLPPPAAAFGGAGNVPAPGAGNQAISSQQTGSLPPVPSSVPSAAGAPAAAPAGVELDVEGIPWDASIHASTKAKLASGAWKVKRGTPELYLKERKELLRQAVAAGGNAAPAGVPATPPASAAVPPPAGAGAPVPPPPSNSGNAPAPIPTPQASGQTTPAAAGSNGAVTMAQVLPRVTAAISAGLLTPDSAAAIVRELSDGKIDNVAMLAVAPQLLAPFAARLDVLGIPA